MEKSNYIILLDWPKGSWKSSISTILYENITNLVILSLDNIRRNIPKSKASAEYNLLAYNILLDQMKWELQKWNNIVIDCGLVQEKLNMLEKQVDTRWVLLLKYYLDGSYDTLLKRVRDRDIKEWKQTNEERFSYIYDILKAKQFINYTYFNVDLQSAQEIANIIISDVDRKK